MMLQKNPNFMANPVSENCYRAIIKSYPTLDAKNRLVGKDPDAEKIEDRRRRG